MFAAAGALAVAMTAANATFAQKQGGILKVHQWDSPPSLSIHEEVTIATVVPMMGVFNNLVMYKVLPHVHRPSPGTVVPTPAGAATDEPQNSLQSVVPDLATDGSWSEDGTQLTFPLLTETAVVGSGGLIALRHFNEVVVVIIRLTKGKWAFKVG
jgi:peptide/nickel transport system substrate-binding protein